jgi:hypothetical protein
MSHKRSKRKKFKIPLLTKDIKDLFHPPKIIKDVQAWVQARGL